MNRLLISYEDSGKMPRAYAVGKPEDELEVKAEADRQLADYVKKKQALGEPISVGDFTLKKTVVDEAVSA